MRRLLLLLFVPTIAFGAGPTFEARSQRFALRVEVGTSGNAAQYALQVTDLATGQVLAAATLSGEKEDSFIEAGDRTVRLRVREEHDNTITATLWVEQGETLVDQVEGRWALKPGPLRVGGDVKAPVPLPANRVEPKYPEDARRARISGIVILQLLIDKEGTVRDVQVLKPLPNGLSEAAIDAVKQWKFQPATRKEQPVGVLFNLTINFRLTEDKQQPPAQ